MRTCLLGLWLAVASSVSCGSSTGPGTGGSGDGAQFIDDVSVLLCDSPHNAAGQRASGLRTTASPRPSSSSSASSTGISMAVCGSMRARARNVWPLIAPSRRLVPIRSTSKYATRFYGRCSRRCWVHGRLCDIRCRSGELRVVFVHRPRWRGRYERDLPATCSGSIATAEVAPIACAEAAVVWRRRWKSTPPGCGMGERGWRGATSAAPGHGEPVEDRAVRCADVGRWPSLENPKVLSARTVA